MRWMVVALAAGLLTVSAGAALAQGYYDSHSRGLEIIPFVGYRWGGGLSSVSGFRSIDTQDNVSAGVALDVRTPGNSAESSFLRYSSLQITVPPRGPRSVLCVVVVT